ncbi:MFS transporter [Nonomuraea sp. NPDC049421]|uniref:MFS transporter n=1 Tax=Nonomuraea sp. NPDC049421 TaxID=3155275 RepID=UPI00342AD75D
MRFTSSGSRAVRPFLVGMFVDALGNGLYVPLTLLFIQQVTGLPPATVGLGVTVAAGLGLAANPVAGMLIDRFDARTVLVGTYVIRALGFAVYPLVDGFGALIAIAAVIAAGDRAYYPASSSYVAVISEGGGRDRLYATQATLSKRSPSLSCLPPCWGCCTRSTRCWWRWGRCRCGMCSGMLDGPTRWHSRAGSSWSPAVCTR